MNKFVTMMAAAVLLAACSNAASNVSYEFTAIRRGDVERTVSSSGKIHPVATVRVLPQMNGKVEKVNVDYNDIIKKGDILAELNTDMLKLKWEQQNSTVVKARANYELQQINYNNQVALAEKNLISEYELKTGKTTLESMAADLAVAESNLRVTQTEINQYAYITSPINGIVLDKTINVGDTVVDSSNSSSSSIFTLAENLSEMQIEATVGELDVSSIHKGQAVRFTLESLPGRTFTGQVETIRIIPTVTSNVVSYTVIIKVENYDGSLLPGMTCAVDFIVERNENVLLVSNVALRYQPSTLSADKIEDLVFNAELKNMSEDQRQAALNNRAQASSSQSGARQAQAQGQNQNQNAGIAGILGGRGFPGGGGGGGNIRQMVNQGQQTRTANAPAVFRNLWYVGENGSPEVVRVRIGISSGSFTEIILPQDLEGREFIMREKI